jgi:hypothetical protein
MTRWFDVGWLVVWGALSSAWCLTAAQDLSATFDEPFYLRAGLRSWRSGSNWELMRAGAMPVPIDSEYLPIYLWERFRGEPFDTETDFHKILPYARSVNLLFWWLQLTYGMLLARTFGGPWAGRFSVVLQATEPNFLGHACLATTDISVTGLLLAFTYHYYHGRDAGRVRRWLIPGILYGISMAAKASALTFVPFIMLAIEVPRWYAAGAFSPPPGVGRLRHFWRATSLLRWDGLKILTVGMVVLWAYCGCDWRPQQSFVKWADGLPEDNRWRDEMRWVAHNLKVFPNAGEGLMYQIKHNIRGHGAVILGEYYPRAIWYYFPVALSIKLTLPVLGLLLGLLLFRPRSLFNPLSLAVLFLLIFSLNCRVQIGVRIVFPVVALLLVTLAVGLARISENWAPSVRWAMLLALSVICAYPAITVWPDGMRYGNELWGGTENTHRHLAEANYDWGQGIFDLDRWTAARGLPPAKVWYYGMDPLMGNDPERLLALHWPKYAIETPADTWKHVRGHVVAVGVSMLYGNPTLSPTMGSIIEFFRHQTPIGRTRNFFVYDFRDAAPPP